MATPIKPKEVIRAAVESALVPALAPLGWTFAPGAIRFSRKVGYVKQTIDFCINYHATRDFIDFWTSWTVRAPAYEKWHAQEWGQPFGNDEIGGSQDGNIAAWRARKPGHFDLSDPKRRAQEMATMRALFLEVGLPFADAISTWEGAAARIFDAKQPHSALFAKGVDFYLIANRRDLAERGLAHAMRTIESFEGLARGQHDEVYEALQKRRARYFPATMRRTT
jgi:hypothetical protein